MARAPNEETLVENAAVEQLKGLGWDHIQGHRFRPEVTERDDFRQVLLDGRLRAALRRINCTADGREWLDESRLNQAVSALERLGGRDLIEANRRATDLLLAGTQVDGDPDLHGGRDVTIHYIDFDHPEHNDFLVINQFRADLPGSGNPPRYIVPDLVLFVNGIPLVVVECKSPRLTNPTEAAITDLLRYSNQRPGAEGIEGVERLFHFNQWLVATWRYEARFGTITSGYEHYLEWKEVWPLTFAQAGDQLGVEQLNSQQMLIQGMLRPENLLDLVAHFTLFKEDAGRQIKIVARYQQYRAVGKAIHRLRHGQTHRQHGEFDQRGGVVWHTQGSGKSLTMVFLVRKMRSLPDLRRFKVVVVTDRRDLEKQLGDTATLTGETVHRARRIAALKRHLRRDSSDLVFGMIQKYQDRDPGRDMGLADDPDAPTFGDQLFPILNESPEILVIVDEAHRTQTSTLHANLMRALPNCAKIGFTGTPIIVGRGQKRTHEIFGDYIDKYTIAQSVDDGSTVQIIYEGKTAEGEVSDARDLDRLFEDMFAERTPEELEAIKQKYATTGYVLEAPKLIAAKAEDMLAHYVANVLPNGFKAQVVATSRLAAVRYYHAFREAHAGLLARLQALDPALLALDEEARETLDAETRFLLAARNHEEVIRRLEFATVISGASTDPADWREFTDPVKQEALIGPNGRFKKPLVHDDPDKQDGLAFIIVKSMLLTGFDAPVEQVLYLDRTMRGAELLQAVARVNRTYHGKKRGYVVDYFGVARHLTEALAVYTEDDIQGAQLSIRDELPRLEDRHRRVLALFHERGTPDISDIDACVFALRDPRLRADFQVRLDRFLESMDIVLPRPEALPYVDDMKRLGFIQKSAANLYRDRGLSLVGIGGKVRQLIDEHITARGIDPKIPPISIFDADFENYVEGRPSARSQALEMEHAARHHISQHYQQDPAFYQKLSQRLDAILAAYRDNWEDLAEELRRFTRELRAGRQVDETGLDPETQAPFLDLILGDAGRSEVDIDRFCAATVEVVAHIQHELHLVDFWHNVHAQNVLRNWLVNYLDENDLIPFEQQEKVADDLIELAQHRHAQLVTAG